MTRLVLITLCAVLIGYVSATSPIEDPNDIADNTAAQAVAGSTGAYAVATAGGTRANAVATAGSSAASANAVAVASAYSEPENNEESDSDEDESEECYEPEPTCSSNEILDKCPVDRPSDYCPRSEEEADRAQFQLADQPLTCAPPECKCRFNYRRADNGTCIPTRDCPPFECSGKNEDFNPCPPICPSDDCSQATPDGRCPRLFGRIGIVLPCSPRCRCKEGYWRKNKICIPYADCKKECSDPNEEYTLEKRSCPTYECSSLVARPICRDAPPPAPGCACKAGFLKINATSPCVPICQCPEMQHSLQCQKEEPAPECGSNEVSKCVQNCPPQRTCKNRGIRVKCLAVVKPCTTKCVCADGFVRNSNGECIKEAQCEPEPPQCGPNEVSKCVQDCPPQKTCDNRNIQFSCLAVVTPCTTKCVCADGYIRNSIGECIKEAQCDKCNDPNEVYTLTKRTCPAYECYSLVARINCTGAAPPAPGCACKDGFLKVNATSPCVPICQCPEMQNSLDCKKDEPTCGPNEILDKCPVDRPSDYCPRSEEEADRAQFQLADQPLTCAPPECKCAFNYRRAENGTCIPTRDCPPFKCSGKNQEFNPCPPLCPSDDCSQASPDGSCPQRFGRIGIVLPCSPKCRCKEGYWRKDNVCVPYADCSKPDPPRCGLNEVSKCVQDCPPEKTCRNRNIEFSCLAVETPCTTKCLCADGYVRNAIGECIKEAQCDQCKGKNEFFSCNTACDNVCADQKQNRTHCLIVNKKCNERCYCDDGYARDGKGNCVPVEQCPIKCDGPNEEFTLEKRSCLPDQCFTLVAKIDCRNAPPPVPGCACKAGFLRVNATSPCVPTCQCPQMQHAPQCQKCPGPNEEYKLEKKSCPPDECNIILADHDCRNATTAPGCGCKYGFLRLEKGSPCIPSSQCPQNTQVSDPESR